MTTIDINHLFEPEDEMIRLEKERVLKLKEYRDVEAKEAEMLEVLNTLRRKKAEVLAQGHILRRQIADLEAKKQRELAEQEELDRLKEEAKKMEAYAQKLEEICKEFPAFGRVYPYQKEDLVFSLKAFLDGKSGVLNCNDMAMGKTIETVILLYVIKQLHPDWKILWLTKKSLTLSTPKEIKKWWPEANLISSAVAKNAATRKIVLDIMDYGADILVANYEFARTTPELHKMKWNVLVVDEAHKLKGGANPSGATDIWKKVRDLCKDIDFKIFLTGTPMVNAPEEMWAYLHIFEPDRFPDVRHFTRALDAYRSLSHSITLEDKATKVLNNLLNGQMFRRTRKEVNLQLPDIIEETIELEMEPEQRKAYDQMRDFFYIWLDQQDPETVLTASAILAQLIRLRQINVWPDNIRFTQTDQSGNVTERFLNIKESSKINEAMEIVDRVNDSIIIGSNFNEPLWEIERRCKKANITCATLTGDNSWDVQRIENEFQQQRVQVLAMNLAVGEGLNLQKAPNEWPGGATYGIALDKWYSPARNEQFRDRIIRPGSTDKGVFYYLENVDSVDKFINLLNQTKSESFDSITGHSSIRPDWKKYLGDKI